MAHDASVLLGAQQLAGTTVNPRGFGKEIAKAQLSFGIAGKRSNETASTTPSFSRIAFLAVTEREVALIRIGSGGPNGRLEEVLARVPRSEIASAEVGGGVLSCPVTISFSRGGSWQLEVSRLIRRQAKGVVRALGY